VKKNKYMRIVLDDDLMFLKSLNGVGAVFNRVFREIFGEIRNCGTDSIATWNALVEGKIGIKVKLETGPESRCDGAVNRSSSIPDDEIRPGSCTALNALMARVKNFDLGD